MEVIAFDSCFTYYTFDHVTGELTVGTSGRYTVAGSGPYTITFEYFSDDYCTDSIEYTSFPVDNECSVDGGGVYNDGTYGYGAIFDTFPDSPNAPGWYFLGFSSECNTEPYSGYWQSMYAITSTAITEYDVCSSGIVATCKNGVGTYYAYATSDCSDYVRETTELTNPKKCEMYGDDATSASYDDYTSYEMYETSYCTAGGDEYVFSPLSDDTGASCFAGSEMVILESGLSKPIADVVVGDRIMASNAQGVFTFSDVIIVPHAKNHDRVMFHLISLANGADIRMTGEHLLPVAASCGADAVFTVTAAKNVAIDSCVMTINGQSAVVSNNKIAGTGIYTIVTNEEYVVVNGVIASPFAASHAIGNTFYNVYRVLYNYVPGAFKSSLFQSFHSTFATLATKTW